MVSKDTLLTHVSKGLGNEDRKTTFPGREERKLVENVGGCTEETLRLRNQVTLVAAHDGLLSVW